MIDGRSVIRQGGDPPMLLTTHYNPPGSCLMAIGATLATAAVVIAVAAQGTPAAGPGVLIWYLVFKYARRQRLDLDLRDVQRIVIDRATRRIVVLATIREKPVWLGFRAPRDFESLAAALGAMEPGADSALRMEEDRTKRTDIAVWIVLFVVLALIAGLIVLAAVSG